MYLCGLDAKDIVGVCVCETKRLDHFSYLSICMRVCGGIINNQTYRLWKLKHNTHTHTRIHNSSPKVMNT